MIYDKTLNILELEKQGGSKKKSGRYWGNIMVRRLMFTPTHISFEITQMEP